jgi:DNA ligase-1
MKRFAELYTALDTANSPRAKIAVLTDYFRQALPEDAIWAIHLLVGKRLRRIISPEQLREWALEFTEIPAWLFEESCNIVGDLTETATLILPPVEHSHDIPLHVWMEQTLLPLREKEETIQKSEILAAWKQMNQEQRLVFNLLLTGRFRINLSERTLVKALGRHSGIAETVLTYRLTQSWQPIAEDFHRLLAPDTGDTQMSQPYPFHPASPLETTLEDLGHIDEWRVEWKWEGLRAQLIKRADEVFLWSGECALVTEKFPKLQEAATSLPDGTVLDGILVPWYDEKPLNAAELQRRMRRKNLTKALLQEIPVRFIAFDLLEQDSNDIRDREFSRRQEELALLTADLDDSRGWLSPQVFVTNWPELRCLRKEARERGAGGLILKRLTSPYHTEKNQKDWLVWKVEPFMVSALLIYAQRIQRPPGKLCMEFTFAVWDQDRLVPLAKASDGLTDEEIQEINEFIRQNTLDRFGPVRSVKPELVFEIAFDGIQKSARRKSGVTVCDPRIVCWQREKKAEGADTLEKVQNFVC